jgi:hypothetical protein
MAGQPIYKRTPQGQMLPGVLPWAIDPQLASRRWELSERLTGVVFVN